MNARRTTGACSLLALVLFLSATHPTAADEPKRVLRFPADRAVGTVYTRPGDENRDDLWNTKDWAKLCDAKGDLDVDAVAEVRLAVSNAASSDLSFLGRLQPDDLHTLELRRSQVNDDQLAHVGRLTELRVLDLDQSRITDAGIVHLAGLTKLRRIGLEAFQVHREGFGVGDEALAILASLPELESVDLRLTKVTDAGLKHVGSRPSLRALSIEGTNVTDAGVVHLKRLPHLEYVRLGVCDEGIQLTDEGLRDIGQIASLKSLDLSGTRITDAGLVHLQGLQNLEDLSLDNTQVTPAGLAALEPLQSLQKLRCYLPDLTFDDDAAMVVSRLKSLRRLTIDLHVTEKGAAALATLPQLETLDLRDGGITDAALAHVGRVKSLKWLDLYDCPVTDDGLAQLAKLDQLELLRLHGTRVTSDGIRHLRRLPRLTHLSLGVGDADESSAAVIASLAHVGQLPHLTNLTLRGDGLTTVDLADLKGMHKLESLTIEGVPVGDLGVFHLAGLELLTELSLGDSVITDEGLAALTNLRALNWLVLYGHFTDEGIQHLAKLKSLQHVYLYSPYLTDDGIARLSAASPSLVTVRGSSTGSGLPEVSYREYDTFRREGLEADRAEKNALELKAPPPWQLTGWLNTDGRELAIDGLAGKVVLVDFWGTWCGPCRAAMPKLKRLQEQYPDDLVVLGIHTTSGAEEMPGYVEEQGFTWPMAADVDEKTVAAWHVDSYPDLYLIDRQGRLRVADLYEEDLGRAIEELVRESASPTDAAESEHDASNSNHD